MVARKGNREYQVTEENKASYVSDGFDIYDGDKLVTPGKGKNVNREEFDKIRKQNQALQKRLEELQEESPQSQPEELMEVLREYADLKGIDLGQASTLKGMMKKIHEARKEGKEGEE